MNAPTAADTAAAVATAQTLLAAAERASVRAIPAGRGAYRNATAAEDVARRHLAAARTAAARAGASL